MIYKNRPKYTGSLSAIEKLAVNRLSAITRAQKQLHEEDPVLAPMLMQVKESVKLDITAIIDIDWLSKNIRGFNLKELNLALRLLSYDPRFYPDLRKGLN